MLLSTIIKLAVLTTLYENFTYTVGQIIESKEEMMERYRLPEHVIPLAYQIAIEPSMDIGNFTWIGRMMIDIEVIKPTRNITLHAFQNLRISEQMTILLDDDEWMNEAIHHHRSAELELLIIEFNDDISIGKHKLYLTFDAVETGYKNGFFMTYSNRNESIIASTYFEPTYARRAFPCWDEPHFKATFHVVIIHSRKYHALSNMPKEMEILIPSDKVRTSFWKTPKMSTYVLTFVITNYTSITNGYANVTFWNGEQTHLALDHLLTTSQMIVTWMQYYTQLPFGVPAVGAIIIPPTTVPSLEHWGLISYSVDTITWNGRLTSTARQDKLDLLIAHEILHAWFGNRVSPRWWNDLWLSEGFATYFSFYLMDKIYDRWAGLELFVVENNQRISFPTDESREDTAVRSTPITDAEIRRKFTAITYNKGASIIHMLHNILGDRAFQIGIQYYLRIHSFDTATAEDLIKAFELTHNKMYSESMLDLSNIMMPWLTQSGYPMINVTRNYDTGKIVVTQRCIVTDKCSTNKWSIPLNYATQGNPKFSSTVAIIWMSDMDKSVEIDEVDKDHWVLFNLKASGYYRVNYDKNNWKRLVLYMNSNEFGNIHVLNRAQLIDDIYYLAERDPSTYAVYFWKLINYLAQEVEYLPWKTAMHTLGSIYFSVRGTDMEVQIQKKIVSLMQNLITRYGFETIDKDDHITKLAKKNLVGWACLTGDRRCSEFAAGRILNFFNSKSPDPPFHPDNEKSIICAALRNLNQDSLERIVLWLVDFNKDLLIPNLGCIESVSFHRSILAYLMVTNITDYIQAFEVILSSSNSNFEMAIEWFMEYYSPIDHLLTWHNQSVLQLIVRKIPRFVTNQYRLNQLQNILRLDVVQKHMGTTISMMLIKFATDKVRKTTAAVNRINESWNKDFDDP